MAPTPAFKPLKPIQDNWNSIKPWHNAYMGVLGGLGTIFGFATAVALIVEHKFKPPKNPFKKERWNPKPTAEKKQEEKEKEEVTEEQIMEDELAEVVGALGKREFMEDDLDWYGDGFVSETSNLSKRDGKDFAQKAGNGTEKALEDGTSGFDKIKEEVGDIVHTAEEVGKEIWDDIKGIFGGNKGDNDEQADANNTASTSPSSDTSSSGNSTEASSRRLI